MITIGRRAALRTLSLAATGLTATGLALFNAKAAPAAGAPILEPGADSLRILIDKLASIPRRRDFKSVPLILTEPSQWDDAAIKAVMVYRPILKQVWNNTAIESYWLTLMRNAINTQIFSFKHPNFLAVSATHGSAGLALYDQAMWDKYSIGKLAGAKFKTNSLIVEKGTDANTGDIQDPHGLYASDDDSIPTLMRRGVVFMACHNAIWAHAEIMIAKGFNPDGLALDALAAELTNHLIPGVILTPGMVGTLPELQQVGFQYCA